MSTETVYPQQGSPGDEVALFHRTLASMCRAGVPLGPALETLGHDLDRGALRQAVVELKRQVDAGTPLHEAYKAMGRVFPPLYAAMLEAGAASGDLVGALDDIAGQASLRASVTHGLRRALAYPLVTAVVVILLGVYVLGVTVPHSGLFDLHRQMGLEMPAATRTAQYLTANYVPQLVVGGCASAMVLLLLFGAWVANPLSGRVFDWPVMRALPGIRRLRRLATLATGLSTLSTLVRRHVPLDKALDLVAAQDGSRLVCDQVAAAGAAVRRGASLSAAVAQHDVLEPSLVGLLAAAERSDVVVDVVGDVAQLCEQRFRRLVERLTVVLEPVAQLLVGVLVLWVFYVYFAAFFPVFKLTGTLGG